MSTIRIKVKLDACGRMCPTPILMLHRAMKDLLPGECVSIQTDDRAFAEDVRSWCEHNNHELVSLDNDASIRVAVLKKR